MTCLPGKFRLAVATDLKAGTVLHFASAGQCHPWLIVGSAESPFQDGKAWKVMELLVEKEQPLLDPKGKPRGQPPFSGASGLLNPMNLGHFHVPTEQPR